MATRLKKSEFFISYSIIITLACFLGGFFLGAAYMKNYYEGELQAVAEAQKKQAQHEKMLREQKLYKDQDFVQFYYNVLIPITAFKDEHFEAFANMQTATPEERNAQLKNLEKLAKNHLQEVEEAAVSPTSPLLEQAKTAYVHSLRAYLDGIEKLRSVQNSNALTVEQLSATPELQPFVTNWFTAQNHLYHAIANWESAYVTKRAIPGDIPGNVSIQQWKTYPFHYRNYLAAEYLSRMKVFEDFAPEDMSARIDSLIRSNQVQVLGIKDIPSAVKMLQVTDAVRDGDFKKLKPSLYPELQMPEMPLFAQ